SSLVAMLVLIGFFSGFYIVPLYTLLQHRAPKTSKGDLIATSNFINVTGGIAASMVFYLLVGAAHVTGLTPRVALQDEFSQGTLMAAPLLVKGRPVQVDIEEDDGTRTVLQVQRRRPPLPMDEDDDEDALTTRIETDEGLLELVGGGLDRGSKVVVSR